MLRRKLSILVFLLAASSAVGRTTKPQSCAPDSILSDVRSALSSSSDAMEAASSLPRDVAAAAADFSSDAGGLAAYRFLSALSSSPAFAREYWHRRPLLVRSEDTGGWVGGSFTVERDLRLIEGSYISGHRTADVLRNGTKTDTWEFRPLKEDAARKTTWEDVQSAIEGGGGGTVYFNTAGSLWPNLGALCRLTGHAFGLPTNVNVYVTPPGVATSVPPHTDRQDVLVFQTAGAKRWRVYAPPPRKRGVDPLNRGKGGDALSFEEMGPPLVDAVLRRGDVLYVPAGFPHTTDTITVVDAKEEGGAAAERAEDVFDETSVHLTMALDTHVWGLTYAHMRWSVLQRCGKPFQISIEDDDVYWDSLETMPAGFLGGEGWRSNLERLRTEGKMDNGFRDQVVEELKSIMYRLEPNRWRGASTDGTVGDGDDGDGTWEELPTDDEFAQVVEYMFRDHLLALMNLQEEMFSDIDPHSEETMIKAYRCTQKQNQIMEKFGAFSKNEAMRSAFEASRMKREAMTKGL